MYFVCPEGELSWRNIEADITTTRKVVTRVIGLKISRHFVIQSEIKPKPVPLSHNIIHDLAI